MVAAAPADCHPRGAIFFSGKHSQTCHILTDRLICDNMKRHRTWKKIWYCLVCGENFAARRRACLCSPACRQIACRALKGQSYRPRIKICPWDLVQRLTNWRQSWPIQFRSDWARWCKENIGACLFVGYPQTKGTDNGID